MLLLRNLQGPWSLGSMGRTRRTLNLVTLFARPGSAELHKLLAYFRLTLPPTLPASASPNIVTPSHTYTLTLHKRLDLILLHLHAPFEEIQVFVGLEGAD